MKLKPLTYKELRQFRAVKTPEEHDAIIDSIFESREINPDNLPANKVQHIIQKLVDQAIAGGEDCPDFLEFN